MHHGPWCGGPPWWYEPTPLDSPTRRPRRRREDLEDYLGYLEEELKRVRHELEVAEPNR
jgi:hypothetical protein